MDVSLSKEKKQKSITIFCCYAHEDERLLNKLKSHLSPLWHLGLITVWYDRNISPGAVWEKEIKQHLNEAQIILLLISPDFMDSQYCYGVEMQHALERHENGEATVIPVILRPTYWQAEPLEKLQALPIDGEPVTSKKWDSQDQAFYTIVVGIRRAVENCIAKEEQLRKDEEARQARLAEEAERTRRIEEEKQRRAAEEQARQAEEERGRKVKEERARQAEEERRRQAEEAERTRREEEERRVEEERERQAKEEQARQAEEERRRQEEAAQTHKTEAEEQQRVEIDTSQILPASQSMQPLTELAIPPSGSIIPTELIAPPSQSSLPTEQSTLRSQPEVPTARVTPPSRASLPSVEMIPLRPPHRGLSRRTVVVGLAGLVVVGAAGGGLLWLTHPQQPVALPVGYETPSVAQSPVGTTLYTYHGHSNSLYGVLAVAWSPDGRRIASGSTDETVQVWDASNGGNVHTYRGHSSSVQAVAWSPDGRRIASGSGDNTVRVWQAP